MSAVNPIDWALDMLSRSILPPETSAREFQQRMDELRVLRANGVTEDSLQCPAPGCEYVCFASPGAGVAAPDVCPYHSVPLVLMTWKQMAERTLKAAEKAEEEWDQRMQRMSDNGMLLVQKLQWEATEARSRLDTLQFTRANDEDELERLRELTAGPIGTFARAMDEALPHRTGQDPPLSGIHSCLDRLKLAMGRNNRLAVQGCAVELGLYAVKLSQLYSA